MEPGRHAGGEGHEPQPPVEAGHVHGRPHGAGECVQVAWLVGKVVRPPRPLFSCLARLQNHLHPPYSHSGKQPVPVDDAQRHHSLVGGNEPGGNVHLAPRRAEEGDPPCHQQQRHRCGSRQRVQCSQYRGRGDGGGIAAHAGDEESSREGVEESVGTAGGDACLKRHAQPDGRHAHPAQWRQRQGRDRRLRRVPEDRGGDVDAPGGAGRHPRPNVRQRLGLHHGQCPRPRWDM